MPSSPRSRPTKQVRIKVALLLTQDEIHRFQARAAGEARPIGNLLSWMIEQHLAKRPKKARKPRDADPDVERISYEVGPFITRTEQRELEKRAAAERRSVSSYVTRLVLEALGPKEEK